MSLVEKLMAQAAFECGGGKPFDELHHQVKAQCIREMNAALKALSDAGYAVVPKEPTEEMIEAGGHSPKQDSGYDDAETVYAAMLKSAPEVT